MTVFLFDNEDGESVLIECTNWSEAERVAEEENLFLFGEFLGEQDA